MAKKYSEELLNLGFTTEMVDGTKVERKFFSITPEDLKDVFHVEPTDSVEIARKKINEVVSKDKFLYEYFHKDPLIWELKEFTPGYWTTPVKEEKILSKQDLINMGYSEAEISKMRFPVKNTTLTNTFQQKLTIKFVKRQPKNVMSEEALLGFFNQYDKEFREFITREDVFTKILKNKVNTKQATKSSKELNQDKLLVIPDVELHLGKLASKFDSNDSYDYKKALYRYVKIMLEIEKVQESVKAKQICMTIGNDFYNTDTEQNTTTAGTEQHNDTRFQQMIATGIVAHVWAIERMKKVTDKVILKYNPGNHDYLIDYTLFMQLYTLYKDDPKVQIDCKVKDIRWTNALKWEENLIIFAHGKTPEGKALNDDALSNLRDVLFREESKTATHTTVLAGHLHNATENNFSRKKKYSNGVTVIRSGSPSGDGAWDSGNLYSSDKSHQVYTFDARRGLYQTTNITLTKEELEKSISVPGVNEETDYMKSIGDSMEKSVDETLADENKKARTANEREISNIKKRYEAKIQKLVNLLSIEDLTDERKEELLEALGFYEEIAPLIETRKQLADNGLKLLKKKK